MAEILYITGGILILPAILFALFAQIKVQSTFSRYGRIPSHRGLTGAQVARQLLDQNGCSHVVIERSRGHLSDHYDPRKKVVRLSDEVYDSTSLAALGVAAHEVGHAVQDNTNYLPLRARQIVIKSTSIINKTLVPLIIIGMIASIFVTGLTWMGIDVFLFTFSLVIGLCILYAISFVVNVITLPTEFNASSRAKEMLKSILYDEEERHGASKVLSAAAMTYVAALIVSLAYLMRFLGLALSMAGRR